MNALISKFHPGPDLCCEPRCIYCRDTLSCYGTPGGRKPFLWQLMSLRATLLTVHGTVTETVIRKTADEQNG